MHDARNCDEHHTKRQGFEQRVMDAFMNEPANGKAEGAAGDNCECIDYSGYHTRNIAARWGYGSRKSASMGGVSFLQPVCIELGHSRE